jgi:hypothetical protein
MFYWKKKRQKIYILRFYRVKKNTVFLPKNKLALTHVSIGHLQYLEVSSNVNKNFGRILNFAYPKKCFLVLLVLGKMCARGDYFKKEDERNLQIKVVFSFWANWFRLWTFFI